MKTLKYDSTTGDLREGMVWQYHTGFDVNRRLGVETKYTEFVNDTSEFAYDCKINKEHQTDLRVEAIQVDVFGGHDPLGNFVNPTNHGFTIISPGFATRLRDSGLTGFDIRPIVKVNVDQTHSGLTRLDYLDIVGRAGNGSNRLVVEGGPDTCPFCGAVPVVCPGCGEFNDPCPKCGQNTIVESKDEIVEGERRIYHGFGNQPKIFVVEERDWDGSDWFFVDGRVGNAFLSNRAKEWLEKTHVFDIEIKPALLARKG